MDFDVYQMATEETAIYPKEHGLWYVALGLTSEAGEVAGKVKKVMRDENTQLTPQKIDELMQEIGDVLWYCARLASEIGVDLDEIAKLNIAKLRTRKASGKLSGSGDNR